MIRRAREDGTELVVVVKAIPDDAKLDRWVERECRSSACRNLIVGPPAKMRERRYCSNPCKYPNQGDTFVARHGARLYGDGDPDWEPCAHSVSDRKWRQNNREKRHAAQAARDALGPATRCEYEKYESGDCKGRYEHHHWSYDRENWLDTFDFCARHHSIADGIRRRLIAAGHGDQVVKAVTIAWMSKGDLSREDAAIVVQATQDTELACAA